MDKGSGQFSYSNMAQLAKIRAGFKGERKQLAAINTTPKLTFVDGRSKMGMSVINDAKPIKVLSIVSNDKD